MNVGELRDEIEHLIKVLGRPLPLGAVVTIQDLVVGRIESVLGGDSPYARAVASVGRPPTPANLIRRIFVRPPEVVMRRTLRTVLRHVHFTLGLGGNMPQPTAAPLAPDAVQQLTAMIDEVVAEVTATPLDHVDREQLLAALEQAKRILAGDVGIDRQRALQDLLGEAVIKVARGGRATPLWRRVTEVIVVAEAAVSLGLGVAAIASTQSATRVEVTCRVSVPALPAGTSNNLPALPSGMPESAPTASAPATAGPQSRASDP